MTHSILDKAAQLAFLFFNFQAARKVVRLSSLRRSQNDRDKLVDRL